MTDWDDAQNAAHRKAEQMYPGYKGPVYGQFTPAPICKPRPKRRTQVSFEGYLDEQKKFVEGGTYWIEQPQGAVLVGDEIALAERERLLVVSHVAMTLGGEYFEQDHAIPHKLGTFLFLRRRPSDGEQGTE